MKKVLVTGGHGLIGSRFVELYSKKYKLITPSFPTIDLTKKKTLIKIIKKEKPDVVVNFAAYTNVSEAESQRNDKKGSCWMINVQGTKNLVSLIDSKNIHLVHISTNYAFSSFLARRGPNKEDDLLEKTPSKTGWYAFTKAESERVVRKVLGEKATILRLAYPVRAKYPPKLDYLRKPLNLYSQGKLYPLFNDQQITITFIDEACLALERIINDKIYGTFHASTPDLSTPHTLISYFIKQAIGKPVKIKSISLSKFLKTTRNSSLRYPKYVGLGVRETEKELGIKFSPWREVVKTIISQGLD